MLLRWERGGAETATSAPNIIEITLTPANGGTKVRVESSGQVLRTPPFIRRYGSAKSTGSQLLCLAPDSAGRLRSGRHIRLSIRDAVGVEAIDGRPLTAKAEARHRETVDRASRP